MISVAILINGHPLMARSATRGRQRDGKTEYHVDDGSIVLHDPSDGAVVLAKMLLDTIKASPS